MAFKQTSIRRARGSRDGPVAPRKARMFAVTVVVLLTNDDLSERARGMRPLDADVRFECCIDVQAGNRSESGSRGCCCTAGENATMPVPTGTFKMGA